MEKLEYTKLTSQDSSVHTKDCIWCIWNYPEVPVAQLLDELVIRFEKTFGDKDGET